MDIIIARLLDMDDNPNKNDEERRLWILNDEGLYNWARSKGVKEGLKYYFFSDSIQIKGRVTLERWGFSPIPYGYCQSQQQLIF